MKPVDPEVMSAFAEATIAQSGQAPLVPAGDVAPGRKPCGQAGHISPQERREIQLAYLTQSNATVSSVARQFGRTREAIAGCVKGEDFEQIRQHVQTELVTVARNRLAGNVAVAADSWVASLGIAAMKGDHKPSKDLLLHTGVIEPLSDGEGKHGISVWVGVSVAADGTRMWKDGRTGRVVPEDQCQGGIVIGTPGFPAGPDVVIDSTPIDESLSLRPTPNPDVAALQLRIAELEAQLRTQSVN